MMHAVAEINLNLDSELVAGIIFEALMPETRRAPAPRSKAALRVEGGRLTLSVEAVDTTALRASLNSYCRWILCLMRVLEAVGEGARYKSPS